MISKYDLIVKIFQGKRYLACAIVSLDVKVKKILGDRRSITEIIESYSEDYIEYLASDEAYEKLLKESEPAQYMFDE